MKTNYYTGLFCILLFVVGTIISSAQSCPTLATGDNVQEFCDADRPRVGNLVAIDGGEGIRWYSASTGGSGLTNTIFLQDGTIYYAGNTAGTCATRLPVEVSISGKPPTNVAVATSRCSSEINTVAQLSADGTNLKWYSERVGGVLLSLNATLVSGSTYWVQQTEGTCTSIRLPTTVTIIDPGEPTGESEQFFCFDPANPTSFLVGDLVATGTDINWYDSSTSNSPLDPTTPLNDNATYYATQTTFPCESTSRFQTIVRIRDTPNPGTNTNLEVCNSITSAINLLGVLDGDMGGTWSGPITLDNGDQGTLDTSLLDIGNYVFTYSIASLNACPEVNASVTVDVIAGPEAGESATLEVCINSSSIDLFTLLGPTAESGGSWSPILNSGTGVFNPAIDTSNIYTYSVGPTTTCTEPDTASIALTVQQTPIAGTDTSIDFCISDAAVDLFTLLSGADAGGTWSPELSSGSGLIDPSVDTAGAYTYTLAATTSCPGDEAVITVGITNQPDAGNDTSIALCTNNDPIDLFTLLGSEADTNGTWSPVMASGTGLYDPTTDAAVLYTYTVPALGTCLEDQATVRINLNTLPNAGINTSINVCGNAMAFDLFTLLGGNADTGGIWSGPSLLSNGDAGTFNPIANTTGAYIYTLTGAGVCEDISTTVQVTITDPTPTLPPNGEIFCIADSPDIENLINRVIQEIGGTIQVYETANGTVPLNGSVDLITGNTYYITETDITSSCEGTNRLETTIQVNDPQAPQLSETTAAFCLIDSPSVDELNAFILSGSNVIWLDTDGNQLANTVLLTTVAYTAVEEDFTGCRSPMSNPINVVLNNDLPPTLNPMGNEFCGVDRPTLLALEANLTLSTGLSVVWYTSQENGTPSANTVILTDDMTYYAASYNPATGCESVERLQITVDLTVCDPSTYPILLPDGFSPNGDGINDQYDLTDVEFLYEDYIIEIYNRYGTQVFKGTNSSPSWDGTSGNQVLPNGVYFYIFNFNRENLPAQQGRIYLNR